MAGADLQVCEVIENAHLKVCAGPVRLDFFTASEPWVPNALTPPTAPLSRRPAARRSLTLQSFSDGAFWAAGRARGRGERESAAHATAGWPAVARL